MTIKIRFQPNNKAVIRWKTPFEKEFMKRNMALFRDSVKNASISVKDERGDELPKIQMPKMMPMPISGQPQTTFSGTPQTTPVIPSNMMPPQAEPIVVKIEPEVKKDDKLA
jgi:hypothetical protein